MGEQNKTAELLPCPFCNCSADMRAVARDWWKLIAEHADDCVLSGHYDEAIVPQDDESKAELVARWNTRAAAPKVEPAQQTPKGKRDSQVITLCGSARFERLFKAWNEALTMAGHTVFSLTAYPSDKAGVKQWYSEEQKVALDAAHLRKIEASDAIFVLNLHAYVGESTLREIEHARRLGKTVYFLESWGKGNGIGGSHTDDAQRMAKADGLRLPTASPIDTTTRGSGAKDPWASSLLGPAGALRSSIVELTKKAALAAQQAPAQPPAKVEREGLTDEQIEYAADDADCTWLHKTYGISLRAFARAIEAAHGIGNP